MNWKSIAAVTSPDLLEMLETFLWEQGAVSVTVTDAGGQPIFEPGPGETPLWKRLAVTGLFEDDVDVEHIKDSLGQEGFEAVQVEDLGDRIWEREWLSRFRPMQFGNHLWVCPGGYTAPADDAVVIHLDPGVAFGTGTHPTTRLCLEWLDAQSLAGRRLVDYGCGSGVLAVGALLLGADEVIAVDNDPQAVTATEENARRNGVSDRLHAMTPEQVATDAVDIVLANILADPLRGLSQTLTALLKPGGMLVMSGIMPGQRDWVKKAYDDLVTFEEAVELDGWIRLAGKKSE